MESDAPTVVNTLNNLATVVGLTARYSGHFAGVDFEEHTLAMLAEFGIEFSGATNERRVFEALPDYRGNKPSFQKGILFCNGEKKAPVTKPEVLAEYIRLSGFNPTTVVVVDDTMKHLEDFEAFFTEQRSGIEFKGFYYKKALTDEQRDSTKEMFEGYVETLINILNPRSSER